MLQQILCFIGLHDWTVFVSQSELFYVACAKCGQPDDFLDDILNEALEKRRSKHSPVHTDLMVAPEELDSYLEQHGGPNES